MVDGSGDAGPGVRGATTQLAVHAIEWAAVGITARAAPEAVPLTLKASEGAIGSAAHLGHHHVTEGGRSPAW